MPEYWLGKKLYPNLPRDMRLRKLRSLLVIIILAIVAALAIGGGLFVLHDSNRL